MSKYFTVEVKPDIDADLLNAAALAGDDDVIFSLTGRHLIYLKVLLD